MQKKTHDDLVETVRKGFVYALRAGTDLIIDLGDLTMNLEETFKNAPWFI